MVGARSHERPFAPSMQAGPPLRFQLRYRIGCRRRIDRDVVSDDVAVRGDSNRGRHAITGNAHVSQRDLSGVNIHEVADGVAGAAAALAVRIGF